MEFNDRFEPVYPEDEFYNTLEERGYARRWSPEIDFGVNWGEECVWARPRGNARLTYMERSGEMIVSDGRTITILGLLPDRAAAERVLDGWAEGDGLLSLVRERLAAEPGTRPWLPTGHRPLCASFEVSFIP